jgi:Holliday junction resolvasome RuvABC ATP-dependent DNA helicase subunit
MLTVNYVGLDKEIRDRIASLSSNEELGEAINKKAEEFTIRIKFDQADPVASASKGIAKLLRAIKEAQKE